MVRNKNSGIWAGEWQILIPAGGGEKNFQELQKREGMEPWHRIEDTTRGKKTSGQGAESPLVKKKGLRH